MPELRPHQDAVLDPISPPNPWAALFWDGTYWRMGRVHTDGTLQVRGEDQLFSFKEVLAVSVAAGLSADDGYIQTPIVPANTIWVVTTARVVNTIRPTTGYSLHNFHDGTTRQFAGDTRAIPQSESSYWSGHVFLDVNDTVRFYSTGGLNGDVCVLHIHGYAMTQE